MGRDLIETGTKVALPPKVVFELYSPKTFGARPAQIFSSHLCDLQI